MSHNENDPIEDTEEAKESSSPEDGQKPDLDETEVTEKEVKDEAEDEKEGETSLEDASPDDLMDILKEIFKYYLAILVIQWPYSDLQYLNAR